MSYYIKRCVLVFLVFFPFYTNMSPRLASQWSGAEYADSLLMTVTGGVSSTAAMGKGVTESQFATKK